LIHRLMERQRESGKVDQVVRPRTGRHRRHPDVRQRRQMFAEVALQHAKTIV
jgi:hypothetical protein